MASLSSILFWLSLFPFVTGWVGENHFARVPMALYGFVMLMAAIAYWVLQHEIIVSHRKNSVLAKAIGRDLKGKISPVLYFLAIVSTFISQWIAGSIYLIVALIWLIPDRRIEQSLENENESG